MSEVNYELKKRNAIILLISRNRNGVKFTCPKSPHNQYMLEHAGGSLKLSVFDPIFDSILQKIVFSFYKRISIVTLNQQLFIILLVYI